MIVMKAPVLEVVLASGVDQSAGTISVTFGSVDRKKFQLDFAPKCVPLAIAALAAEMGKLVAALPAERTPDLQGIRAIGTQLAMKDDGTVAILLRLESGADLPLEFQAKDLARLRDQIDEAAKLADPKARH
ncbi:hypothetical protein [Mesorhizobium sp.]|uniref:hypothetical protein n=1 Tax=Mesorhizobium sp. TaxID=1871066 RepID=UPI00120DCD94|nr:hypothetical protein [Mesorhizobium sp.]TIW97182.1 MAG: hypothetical protein E5V45_17200 [Mesorhizobium sp.]